jgi:tellurite methyltransferase
MRPFDDSAPPRRIVGFSLDDAGDWVAELECGHRQHVRHAPPLASRPWVLSADGRASRVGTSLPCVRCLTPRGATSA